MRYLLYAFTLFWVAGLSYALWHVREVSATPIFIYLAGATVSVGLCAIVHSARNKSKEWR